VSAVAGEVSLVAAADLADPRLTDPWRGFAEARSNPFITPEWTAAWLASHPADAAFVLAWRPGGELRGVLPLVASRRGPARMLRFAGGRRADWVSAACAAADEGEMAAACTEFLRGRRDWHGLVIDRLEGGSAWTAALACGTEGGVGASYRRRDVLPYIEFPEDGYEGYLAARSRNFRSQLGRRRRKLENEHELAFRMTTDPDRLATDLDDFFRLHDARWEDRGGSSSADPAVRAHQLHFAAAALERGWLRLWFAEADGKAAASWYGWRIGNRYCYALAGLDEEYEPLALGTVLLAHTIEQAAAEGAGIYDMMWGDEGYKKRFETGRRHADSWLLARRRSPIGATLAAGVDVRRRIDGLPPETKERLARLKRGGRG
jgi:CelD/BcsL family acetyltransferase involved in cellulose biosynthesis